MEDNQTTNLMSKKLDDLTVGDAIRINLIVLAATAGVIGVVAGAEAGSVKVKSYLRERKARKTLIDNDDKE